MRFKDLTAVANVKGKKGWATGVTMVDVNQGGFFDIYVGRAGVSKMRTEGEMNFEVMEMSSPVSMITGLL